MAVVTSYHDNTDYPLCYYLNTHQYLYLPCGRAGLADGYFPFIFEARGF